MQRSSVADRGKKIRPSQTASQVKPAARVFLDWAASPAAFTHYTKYAAVVSHDSFRSVPPKYPPKPFEQLADLDLRQAAASRDRILQEWNRRYGGKSER